MKLTKLFGVVLGLHVCLITVLIVQPGCSTTQPPTRYEQDTPTSWNKANTLEEVLPEVSNNPSDSAMIDPAFNDGFFTEETLPSPEVAESAPIEMSGPEIEVTGASFKEYTVQSGDNMWSIARNEKISLKELLAVNNMTKESILPVGRVIKIPVESSIAKAEMITPDVYQPSGFNAATTTYTVSGGDTLSVLARRFNTSVSAIKAANNKSSDMIRIGENLLIPVIEGSAAAVEPAVQPAPTAVTVEPTASVTESNAPVELRQSDPLPEEVVVEKPSEPIDANEILNNSKVVDIFKQPN